MCRFKTQKYKTRLAKQDQVASFMWVNSKIIINILTVESKSEIAHLYHKKIHNTVVNKYCILN